MMLVRGGFQGDFLSKLPTFLVVEGSNVRIYLLRTCCLKLKCLYSNPFASRRVGTKTGFKFIVTHDWLQAVLKIR